MSEAKHTPGPWLVERAENGHTAVYPTGGRERVADIYCPLDVPGHHTANARLIAAAPELLEALDRAIPWLGKLIADGAHRNSVLPRDAERTLDLAESAVSKARGPE